MASDKTEFGYEHGGKLIIMFMLLIGALIFVGSEVREIKQKERIKNMVIIKKEQASDYTEKSITEESNSIRATNKKEMSIGDRLNKLEPILAKYGEKVYLENYVTQVVHVANYPESGIEEKDVIAIYELGFHLGDPYQDDEIDYYCIYLD